MARLPDSLSSAASAAARKGKAARRPNKRPFRRPAFAVNGAATAHDRFSPLHGAISAAAAPKATEAQSATRAAPTTTKTAANKGTKATSRATARPAAPAANSSKKSGTKVSDRSRSSKTLGNSATTRKGSASASKRGSNSKPTTFAAAPAKQESEEKQPQREQKQKQTGKKTASASSPRRLYDLLGVPQEATEAEISKAYRAVAMLLHPDKVLQRIHVQQQQGKSGSGTSGKGEKQKQHQRLENKSTEELRREATKHFQELQHAYAILKDPLKRRLYDQTGVCGDHPEEYKSFEEAYAYYRSIFPEFDDSSIEAYRERYIGSEEEREDIIDFCKKFNGDLSRFFEFLPFSEKLHLPRYLRILAELQRTKAIEKTKILEKSIGTLEQQAEKYERLVAKETRQLSNIETEKQAIPDKATKKRKKEDSFAELALALKKNSHKRAQQSADFLAQLERKFARPRSISGKGAKKGGKR